MEYEGIKRARKAAKAFLEENGISKAIIQFCSKTGEKTMNPGGYDIIIQHRVSTHTALFLTEGYFLNLWPDAVIGLDYATKWQEVFVYENEGTKKRIDAKGVIDEPGFVHILSHPNEITVVVNADDEFGRRCKQEITATMHANIGF